MLIVFKCFIKSTPVAGSVPQPQLRNKQCFTEALTKRSKFFFGEMAKEFAALCF